MINILCFIYRGCSEMSLIKCTDWGNKLLYLLLIIAEWCCKIISPYLKKIKKLYISRFCHRL